MCGCVCVSRLLMIRLFLLSEHPLYKEIVTAMNLVNKIIDLLIDKILFLSQRPSVLSTDAELYNRVLNYFALKKKTNDRHLGRHKQKQNTSQKQ